MQPAILQEEKPLNSPNPAGTGNKVYHHPGLQAVNHIMSARPKARILDLGAPSSASFNFYRQNSCRIHFENLSDFISSAVLKKLNWDVELFQQELKQYLSVLEPTDTFDAILCWDIFCYLDENTTRFLSDILSKHCRSNTIVHMVRYWNGQFPQTPCEFKVIAGEQASNNFDNIPLRQHLKLPTASKLAKMMPAFKLERHFVQEAGMHPSMTEALYSLQGGTAAPSRPIATTQDSPAEQNVDQQQTSATASTAGSTTTPSTTSSTTPTTTPTNKSKKLTLKQRANHQSAILPKIFDSSALKKRKDSQFNILDLGALNEDNARFYNYFSDQAIFANIPLLLNDSNTLTQQSLPALLPMRQSLKFDVIMGWDILCRSTPEQVSRILELLKPHMLPSTKMHLMRYAGNNSRYEMNKHDVLSPRYLELSGQLSDSVIQRLSMMELIRAIGFGNIEESGLFLQGMLPDINEYLVGFNL